MISEKEVRDSGYQVLPRGGWIYVDPEILPRDWDDLATSFGFDPECQGVYLCIAGFKERFSDTEIREIDLEEGNDD